MSGQVKGIGAMWGSLTRTVTHSSNTVGNLASATDALSQNAELNAWVSVAKSSMELCDELGVKGTEDKPLSPDQAMQATREILNTLRGY